YKGFEFSFNIHYKLGYYFRNPNSLNSLGLSRGTYAFSDYQQRWKDPGDELITTVPSFKYPSVLNREEFYGYSSVLGVKGDHIRLQDVRLSYQLANLGKYKKVSMQVYSYVSNIGILWKHKDLEMDPAILTGYPSPLEVSFGMHINF
ncbi:MAG: SusC/RagA family TonB-linked outer membrane protein, partial [Sphingobacterium sp.]